MTVEEIDAIISQTDQGLAYIKAEEIDGTRNVGRQLEFAFLRRDTRHDGLFPALIAG
jgi:hypothetical protein